jgi:hypothetical protein
MKTIQQVFIDDEKSLYILSYDQDKKEMTFRVSLEPKQIHCESIIIDKGLAYTNLYFFPIGYLKKFISETI